MDKCTDLRNKVMEARFNRIRDRQVHKFNRLVEKRDRGRGTNAQSIGNNNQLQASSNNNKWVTKFIQHLSYTSPRVLQAKG